MCEIKDCPMCGGKAELCAETWVDKGWGVRLGRKIIYPDEPKTKRDIFIKCTKCGLSSSKESFEFYAIKNWNKRAKGN